MCVCVHVCVYMYIAHTYIKYMSISIQMSSIDTTYFFCLLSANVMLFFLGGANDDAIC